MAPPPWRRSTPIAQRLKARAGEADLDTAWREEWAREADRVAKLGDDADAEGNTITAGNQYMRAGNYYYSAERFIPPGEEKLAMYRKALRCYQGAMAAAASRHRARRGAVREQPACRPGSSKAAALGRRPTVVLFDGMDNAKEMSVIFAGLDFAKRGINTLAIDGPGQSEPLRLRNIPSRHDYEAAGIAGLRLRRRAARGRPQARRGDGLQLRRLSRAAHLRLRQALRGLRRFGAMHWNVYDFVNRPRAGRSARRPRPRPSSSAGWSARRTTQTALEWAKKFTLEGVADKVECPILILHGENDRIVPLAEAQKLYERVGSKNKTLKIFTAEEGGAEHCQVDHRQLGVDFIGDWLLKNM